MTTDSGDSYQHSSWATCLFDRTAIARHLLQREGCLFASINEVERPVIEFLLDSVFGRSNRIGDVIWVQDTVRNNSPTYSTNHEYVQVYALNKGAVENEAAMFREEKPGFDEIMAVVETHNSRYSSIKEIEDAIVDLMTAHRREFEEAVMEQGGDLEEEKKNDPWKGIYNYRRAEYRNIDGKLVSPLEAQKLAAKIWVWREVDPSMPSGKQAASTKDRASENYRYYTPPHPATGKPCAHPKRGWAFPFHSVDGRTSFDDHVADNRIVFKSDESKPPQIKYFLHEVADIVSKSVIRQYADGEQQLAGCLGITNSFPNPKPPALIKKFIAQTTNRSGLVLDFFAGSGTSGHAVIDLNRADAGRLKYLLVEMGEYFEAVITQRLKKVVYAANWQDGKPQSRYTGISHAFKTVRLESYEDTLNNLRLTRTPEQVAALSAASEQSRDQYLLGYFLDVESAGSASLLDLAQFRDPFGYKLKIATSSAGETTETVIDLVETFNWLLGLKVKHVDARKGFLTATGERRAGGRVLVIWRRLSDDPLADNAALEQFLGKITVNPADTEFEFIYVNGSHTLADPHNKVHLTEEAFQRLMFDVGNFESLE